MMGAAEMGDSQMGIEGVEPGSILAPKKAEQDAAEQPATAVESK